jgi:broad specificity phosphatase PhoE
MLSPVTVVPGRILLIRHGETEWSRAGRHTGRTDIPLTAEGEARARALGPRLSSWRPALALCSPLVRARRTAELAGFSPTVDADLLEWDYGDYEGRTTDEIREALGDPQWSVWTTRRGLAESVEQVGERTARVLDRCRAVTALGEDAVLVAHAHVLRILTAVWIGMGPHGGAHLVLGAAGTGVLGYERESPVLRSWNV